MITSKIREYCTLLFQIKLFGSLLEISLASHIFLKAFNSKFLEIEVWLTNQNSQLLEIEDKINLTMVIKQKL